MHVEEPSRVVLASAAGRHERRVRLLHRVDIGYLQKGKRRLSPSAQTRDHLVSFPHDQMSLGGDHGAGVDDPQHRSSTLLPLCVIGLQAFIEKKLVGYMERFDWLVD